MNQADSWINLVKLKLRAAGWTDRQVDSPSPLEQRRIIAYLDQVQAQVTALKQAQKKTETELHRLEQTILDKAFRGEL